jgi:hypothetical protein
VPLNTCATEDAPNTAGEPPLTTVISSATTEPVTTTATTLPEPDPFDQKWPTEFRRAQLTSRARQVMSDFFEAQTKKPLSHPVTVHIQDTVDTELHPYATEAGDSLISSFNDYLQSPTHIFVGTSVRWLIERARELNVALPPSSQYGAGMPRSQNIPFENWGPDSFPDGTGSGWAYEQMAWVGYEPGLWSKEVLALVTAHEAFHSVHLSLDGGNLFANVAMGDNDPTNRPRWFIEGTANFFSYILLDSMGTKKYVPDIQRGDARLDDFLGLATYENWFSPEEAYSYGQIAVEYLVANVGVDPVMQIFIQIGNGDLFPDAFETTIGMTTKDFYELFDAHVIIR